MRPVAAAVATVAVLAALAVPGAGGAPGPALETWPHGVAVVGYATPAALAAALEAAPARVLRRLPALRAVEVRPAGSAQAFARRLAAMPGIRYVEPPAVRVRTAPGPARRLSAATLEWRLNATRAHEVPDDVLRAASAVTIAVVDTGADLSAPDLAAKAPLAHSVLTDSPDVEDEVGHGTFVASIAAGAVSDGAGISGSGGDARLLVVKASEQAGEFSDVDEAAAIVYAVDNGAKIVNLSLGGPDTTQTERAAVDYAVSRGALLVAAVGNEYRRGNPVEYPAALLQPVGSNGQGGVGLAVAATDGSGARAPFSNTGSHVSLAAPGVDIVGAVAARAAASFTRVAMSGSNGSFGVGSGTSFAAPQVSGAAALVWAANPSLTAQDVARILKETASGHGVWNDRVGYGVLDVAAAVARARNGGATAFVDVTGTRSGTSVRLRWEGSGATAFRVLVAEDGAAPRTLLERTRLQTASFELPVGHSYTFVVSALDVLGTEVARSRPFTVRMLQGRATLALRASKPGGRDIVDISFSAALRTSPANVPAAGRVVVLESLAAGRWSPLDRRVTDTRGRAVWRVQVEVGRYLVRARLVGDDELRTVVSSPVRVAVR
jgi:subtilisin family serine protease